MRNRIVMVDILTRKFKSVYYKQYDENNELNIVVYEGKTLANISNYAATVYFELPSGKVYEVDGVIENNAIKVILSSSILEEYGQVNVECKLSNLDEVVTTFTFYLNVEKSINRVGTLNPDVQPPQQTYHTHSNLDVLNQITQEMIDSIDSSEELIDLSIYQTKRDTTLETDEKTVTGAINELNEKIGNISVNVDLSDYALKSELPIVPTNVSELNNDMGYLTEVPSEYITETELDNKGFATESFVTNKISETQLSGEQAQQLNDAYAHSQTPHVQQSDIPTKTSELTNDSDFATNASVDEKIANVSTGESVDLTLYAKKTDLPTKTSQLANDSGYLTEHQDISGKADRSDIPTKLSQLQNDSNFISSIPEEYITETELNAKGYLTEHQSLEDYALKTELPSVPTKTSQLTNDSGFITAIPSEYVTESELSTELSTKANTTDIPSLNGYATETYVQNKIAEASLSGGQVDLSGYATKDELKTKANVSHTHTMSNITDLVIPDVDKAYVDTQLNTKANKSDIPTVPTKTSQLQNDSGYLTSVPSEYITETELESKGYLTEIPSEYITETELTNKGYLTEHQDISGKADKSYVDTELSKKSNTNHTHNQYLTEHQDISGKADKSEIPTKTSQLQNDSGYLTSIPNEYITETELESKGYATETFVTEAINNVEASSHTHSNKELLDSITAENIHTHINKNVIDAITGDMTSKWNKSIPFENSYVSDCNLWLTNGYTKTDTSTLNHPSVCTAADRWGVLFYISENAKNGTGTQMYFPIDGTYAGRVFTRKILSRNAGEWNLLSTFDGNYDNLTNKPTIPTNVSQLTNDSGYLTSVPSGYVTETELNAKGYLTEHQDISGKANTSDLSTVATSGSYNDLTNKPTIPTKTSQLTNDSSFVTESYVTKAINDASLGGGSNIASELTFSTLAEALSYGYSTNDVGKKIIVNDGKYIVTTTSSDWTLSTSTNNIYLSITNTDYVSYAMFGCPLNGTDDDTVGMQKAHAYSNANKILLKNNSGTIYKADNTIIKVKWDMDLSGSTILVKNNNCEGMYQIVNDTETVYGYTKNVDKTYLRQGTCQFPMTDNSLPANCVIHMSDGNAWATRNDAGNIYTEKRYELMFHHAFGICSGDLVADWSGDDTKLTFNYSKYNNRRLTVRGCRIRLESTSTIYCCLFDCRRHNTLITDMFIDTKPSAITSGTSSFKNAIIQIKDCYNITVSNVTGTNIAGDEATRKGSGYTIRLLNVYKCVLDNININGFWGATGMNCVKDITIQNTTINRIDVHSYFNDMNVRDTTVYDWGICLGYGSGSFTANNVKFVNLQRPNMGGRYLVELNNTYGNLFSGDITLRDCEMITDGNDMSVIKLDFIGSNTPTRASVRMPNINIHNLKATNISSTEASLYMFNINGTSDFSSTQTKIGRANYFKFEDISFNNLSNVNQDIQFIWDSTTKDMYQTNVRTNIRIKNTNFNQTLPNDGLFAYVNCGEYITNKDISTVQEEVAALSYDVMMLQPNTVSISVLSTETYSPKFKMIKIWYKKGFWTESMVQDAVDKGVIIQEEFNEIVNK